MRNIELFGKYRLGKKLSEESSSGRVSSSRGVEKTRKIAHIFSPVRL